MSSRFVAAAAAVVKHARKAVVAAAFDLEAEAKLRVQTGPKTGKVYKRAGSRGPIKHQASAPGEAPANEFGVLAGSIQTAPDPDPTALEARVLVFAEYGAALELGREDGTILPRPFLRPAADKVERGFASRVGKAVQAGLREGAAGQ